MAALLISFENQNLRLGADNWLFRRRESMRFEWLALLAFKRTTEPGDQAWVTLDEIARLPHWSGKRRHHIATNIGRYLQSPELQKSQIVTAATRWAGPYRLNTGRLSIGFDVPAFQVRKRLQIRLRPASNARRDKLYRFASSYARAQWLFFQGRLVPPRLESTAKIIPHRIVGRIAANNAYEGLVQLALDRSYGPTLRLLACLSAADVLYRLGRIGVARQLLLQSAGMLRTTPDLSLKAQFHLKLAWAHQRASSGPRSDRAVKAALNRAGSYAENSGDRAALGLLAYRTAGYLTKKGLHMEAVNQFLLALEAYLITGDYDAVQCTCGNIGSIIHRLGSRYYPEARRWLLLSIVIARWMRVGRDDAHAEMILGKILAERGLCARSRRMLERAERIATRAGSKVNLADVKMVWAFWYQRFGTPKQQGDTLVSSLRIFRSLKEFDVAQKEKYIERRFPKVWYDVVDRIEP
jgi:hypothetical protein